MTPKGHHPEVPCSRLVHAEPCLCPQRSALGRFLAVDLFPHAMSPIHDWQPVCSRSFKDLSLRWASTSTARGQGHTPTAACLVKRLGLSSAAAPAWGPQCGSCPKRDLWQEPLQGPLWNMEPVPVPQGELGELFFNGIQGRHLDTLPRSFTTLGNGPSAAPTGPKASGSWSPRCSGITPANRHSWERSGRWQGRAGGPLCLPAANSDPVPVNSWPLLAFFPEASWDAHLGI